MVDEAVLQTILGTDRRNPVFSLCREQKTGQLYVYYGAQLLEIVPDDWNHISFKTLVGRLFNARLNRTILAETFNVTYKTMQKWGKALLISDPEVALKILSGRDNCRKLTPEIQAFIRTSFDTIYKNNKCKYSKNTLIEVKKVYGVTLSSETIRCLLKECKKEFEAKELLSQKMDKVCDSEDEKQPPSIDEVTDNTSNTEHVEVHSNRKGIPLFLESEDVVDSKYIHYAGLFIFAHFFPLLSKLHKQGSTLLKQWYCCFLLEVVTIEQSKYLNHKSLSFILGQTLPNPQNQRTILSQIASEELRLKILALNGHVIAIQKMTAFYYDPHTKHYTGEKKILKGWCASKNGIAKVLHSDYIHTVDGQPVYISYHDNFYDLRDEDRFRKTILDFKKTYKIIHKITIIVDRGIFGKELFLSTATYTEYDFVTWEKDYIPQKVKIGKHQWKTFSFTRSRNKSSNRYKYDFKYFKTYFDSEKKIIRYIVQATNPQGKTIEVGVLTSNLESPAEEIITLIFKRWVQENSFKYLIEHFGINKIDSYDAIDYKKLRDTINDKKMRNGEHKSYTNLKGVAVIKLKNLLLKKHNLSQKKLKLNKLELEIAARSDGKANKDELKKLKQKRISLQKFIKKHEDEDYDTVIKETTDELDKLTEKQSTVQKEISRLEYCINENYKRLETKKKGILDALRLFAFNSYFYYFKTFREHYDNLRDDHSYFRNIIKSDGMIHEIDNELRVIVKPEAHCPPKLERAIDKVLEEINQTDLRVPNGSNQKFTLELNQNIGFEFAIPDVNFEVI